MPQYKVYHYDDELGGQYPEPMLAMETDDLKAAKAEVGRKGGYVQRVSDGAVWDDYADGWITKDGKVVD